MSEKIEGMKKLNRRLDAISDTAGLLKAVQLRAVAEAKQLVPRKTGYLGRSIIPGSLSRSFAIVQATAGYAAYVELGTRPHVIVPRRARVLAWPVSGRLSGRPRSGSPMIFARRVNHPGTKAQPYLLPGAEAALRAAGFRNIIVKKWNDAS